MPNVTYRNGYGPVTERRKDGVRGDAFKRADGEWGWRLVARNGRKIAGNMQGIQRCRAIAAMRRALHGG